MAVEDEINVEIYLYDETVGETITKKIYDAINKYAGGCSKVQKTGSSLNRIFNAYYRGTV
jgi:hypothetical protein